MPDPHLADGEVLVAVERAGICGSDLAVFQGSRQAAYPLVMGHEAVGRIVDSGDSAHVQGTRVVIEPNIPCGTCLVCRRGHANVCPAKRSLGMNEAGVFAEMVAVPSDYVHPLPTQVTFNDAVAIEPLAVAIHALGAGQVAQGEPVMVIGCGAEGLLLVQVAVACGARVLAADLRPTRLAVAQRFGAERVVTVPAAAALADLETIAGDWCPAVVFEAAGVASALELALQVVASGGRVVAVGLAPDAIHLVPLSFVRRGLSLIGSLIYDHPTDFQCAIDMVRRASIQPGALVTDVLHGLDVVPAALQALASGDPSGKTVINVSLS